MLNLMKCGQCYPSIRAHCSVFTTKANKAIIWGRHIERGSKKGQQHFKNVLVSTNPNRIGRQQKFSQGATNS